MGSGEIRECVNGHHVAVDNRYCTICGGPVAEPAPSPAPRGRRRRMALAAVVLALGVGAAAGGFALAHSGKDETASSTTEPPPSTIDADPVATTATTSTTATPTTATSQPPPPVVTTESPHTSGEVEAARSAAVVFYTYGIVADGYPTLEELVAPSARPATDSMIIGPDYRNAGCTQTVESIDEDPIPTPPTYGFTLTVRYQCPDGAPSSTLDGSELALTETFYLEVTVEAAPTGGYWATQIQPVDMN